MGRGSAVSHPAPARGYGRGRADERGLMDTFSLTPAALRKASGDSMPIITLYVYDLYSVVLSNTENHSCLFCIRRRLDPHVEAIHIRPPAWPSYNYI